MKNEKILNDIQDWTNNVPLIIIGSGASVNYGLPSMGTLGNHLSGLTFDNEDDQQEHDRFVEKLNKIKDLETVLGDLHLSQTFIERILEETWSLISQRDIKAYNELIDGKPIALTNLIQHLLATSRRKLSIITTNYDRLIEYAASMAGAFLCTGYSNNYFGQFSNQIPLFDMSRNLGYKGQVNIWKVHGSIDWFKTEDGRHVYLPLRDSIPKKLKASIVTPGLSKYAETHNEPYRSIFTEADKEITNASSYLCIGYGFNDAHVQPKLIENIKAGKPIIVITKEITENTKKAILENGCKNYLLLEEGQNKGKTRIYSSTINNVHEVKGDLWQLDQYLKLLKD